MAQQSLVRLQGLGRTAKQRRREDQDRRRNLRIAIRQLERAELYLVALYSLNLEDTGAPKQVDDLVGRLRTLLRSLVELKVSA